MGEREIDQQVSGRGADNQPQAPSSVSRSHKRLNGTTCGVRARHYYKSIGYQSCSGVILVGLMALSRSTEGNAFRRFTRAMCEESMNVRDRSKSC